MYRWWYWSTNLIALATSLQDLAGVQFLAENTDLYLSANFLWIYRLWPPDILVEVFTLNRTIRAQCGQQVADNVIADPNLVSSLSFLSPHGGQVWLTFTWSCTGLLTQDVQCTSNRWWYFKLNSTFHESCSSILLATQSFLCYAWHVHTLASCGLTDKSHLVDLTDISSDSIC